VNKSVLYDEFGLCTNVATILRFYVFGANCRAGVARHHATIDAEIEPSSISASIVVATTYDIVRYVNSDVKSMCSITATPDDIVRHRPLSFGVVRSVNTA